jgi:hypothetical protein
MSSKFGTRIDEFCFFGTLRMYKPKSQTSHWTVLSASARRLHWLHPYINELHSMQTLFNKTCEFAQIGTVRVVVVVVVVYDVTAI